MKISELLAALKYELEERGDVNVWVSAESETGIVQSTYFYPDHLAGPALFLDSAPRLEPEEGVN